MTNTTETKPELSIEDSLTRIGDIYADAFAETMIPLVIKSAGYEPVGKLTGIAKLSAQGVSVDLVFEYDNKNPDMWEEAQRYIFERMLAMYVDHYAKSRQK